MKKVLILQEIIIHYRIPLFNEIAKDPNIQLTVAYDEINPYKGKDELRFDILKYSKSSVGKFYKINNLRSIIEGYDKIVMVGNLRYLPVILFLLWNRKKADVYFWGIGISSEAGLRKKSLLDKLRFFLNDKSSGTILYTKKISEYYIENVKKKDQVFVAPNTVHVEKYPFTIERRTSILSMGTFNKNKNLGNLVIAFNAIKERISPDITLDFIGDGVEEGHLRKLVAEYGLQDRVNFWGRKETDEAIYPIIKSAMVCVSPTQAGLSVLHAMAFGCPFMTAENAITGGEKFYIEDNVNGYYYDGSVEQLIDKLVWIVNNPEMNNKICRQAYDFYHEKCTMKNYADAFRKALYSKDIVPA
jgi:glycosyltransferase involved in cell wall biosynthesis